MFDYNVLIAIVVVVAFFLYLRFGRQYIKDNTIFTDVRLALLLTGEIVREDKVKEIISIVESVVADIEEMHGIENSEKEAMAVQTASENILDKLNIEISEDTLALIVKVAVSYLPATNK
jgi:predicted site-specific integrase-resolvase